VHPINLTYLLECDYAKETRYDNRVGMHVCGLDIIWPIARAEYIKPLDGRLPQEERGVCIVP
jgi:hypothetical protein